MIVEMAVNVERGRRQGLSRSPFGLELCMLKWMMVEKKKP
jgi:hypothetical protein